MANPNAAPMLIMSKYPNRKYTIMTSLERIAQLRSELHHHNHNYYVKNMPEISDFEFDRLMRELQDLEA